MVWEQVCTAYSSEGRGVGERMVLEPGKEGGDIMQAYRRVVGEQVHLACHTANSWLGVRMVCTSIMSMYLGLEVVTNLS